MIGKTSTSIPETRGFSERRWKPYVSIYQQVTGAPVALICIAVHNNA
jgi:hypothetical protein